MKFCERLNSFYEKHATCVATTFLLVTAASLATMLILLIVLTIYQLVAGFST